MGALLLLAEGNSPGLLDRIILVISFHLWTRSPLLESTKATAGALHERQNWKYTETVHFSLNDLPILKVKNCWRKCGIRFFKGITPAKAQDKSIFNNSITPGRSTARNANCSL